MDVKRQTGKAGDLIINDPPGPLGFHAAELDNERLLIEQVYVRRGGGLLEEEEEVTNTT